MSFRAKRELLVQVAPRYRAARHGQRSVILDEFVAVTGYDRKYAIRLLLLNVNYLCRRRGLELPLWAGVAARVASEAEQGTETLPRRAPRWQG